MNDQIKKQRKPLAESQELFDRRYQILQVISFTTFGIRYLAYDLRHRFRVFIDEFFPEVDSQRESGTNNIHFLEHSSEILKKVLSKKITQRINFQSEHILNALDGFEENGTIYFVYKHIDGELLSDKIAQKEKDKKINQWISELSNAIAFMHENNVLHLDVSPNNIIIAKDKAYLASYGFAQEVKAAILEGPFPYNNGYSPQEQRLEGLKIGTWTDIFSLAMTFYCYCTHKDPKEVSKLLVWGVSEVAPIHSIIQTDEIMESNPNLDSVFQKALSIDYKKRYTSIIDFKHDFEQSLKTKFVVETFNTKEFQSSNTNKKVEENKQVRKRISYKAIGIAFMLFLAFGAIYHLFVSNSTPTLNSIDVAKLYYGSINDRVAMLEIFDSDKKSSNISFSYNLIYEGEIVIKNGGGTLDLNNGIISFRDVKSIEDLDNIDLLRQLDQGNLTVQDGKINMESLKRKWNFVENK